MKEPFSDEILSAYVDSELSAAERAEVERWLETSPAAREKLEEFQRLSGLFAGLPRTEAPQEFPTKVMQLAERRMLLPESLAVSTRRRFHLWVLAVGAPIASAAVLFLIVYLSQHGGDPALPGDALARREHAAPVGLVRAGDDARDREDSPGGEARQSGALVAQNEADKGADKPVGERSAALMAKSADNGAAAPAAASPGDSGPGVSGAGGGGLGGAVPPAVAVMRAAAKRNAASPVAPVPGAPFDDDAAGLPQLAEFNRAIQKLDENDADHELVSVVKVYVADSADGMVLLQSIFAENDVLSDGEGAAKDGAGKQDRIARKTETQAQAAAPTAKEALYVVAEPRQLIAAFTEILSREDPGVRLAVEEPIEIAALDTRLQEQLKEVSPGLADSGLRRRRRREISAKKSVAGDKAPAPADGKSAADETEKLDSSKSGANSDAKTDSKTDVKPGAKGGGPPRTVSPLAEKKSAAEQALDSKSRGTKPVADGQEAAGANRAEQSRQLVVPMPEVIRKRVAFGGKTPGADGDADAVEKGKARMAGKAGRGDEKALAATEEAEHAPSRVRVLFVIEREPGAVPASPPAASPPSGK